MSGRCSSTENLGTEANRGDTVNRIRSMVLLGVLALIAVAAFAIVGCGSDTGDADSGGEEEGPIVVGAAQGLTGFMVTWDGPVNAAAELAVEDINADGGVMGRQLQMETADTKSDVALGPTAASQALEKGAQVLYVATDFDGGSPAALVAQNAGVVSLSAAVSPLFGVEGVGDLAFSVSDSAVWEAAAGAQFAIDKGWKNVFILVDETVAAERDFGKYFEETFTHLGGAVAGRDVFKNDDQSIAAQITKIKSASPAPDVLVLASYAPGGPAALRQIRAAGIDIPMIGADDWDGTFWLEAVPDVKDVYGCVPASMFGDDPRPEVNEFFDRLREKLGKEVDSALAIGGYTGMQAWSHAVEEAGVTEGQAVATALEQLKEFPTISGPVTYSDTVHIITGRPITIIGFWENDGHFVEQVMPEYVPEYEFGSN
jgi:branched-chain amino acid transport system substrate-binding protein